VSESDWELSGVSPVTCHSRVIGGVLCRWWGDGDIPVGVEIINHAADQAAEITPLRQRLEAMEELRFISRELMYQVAEGRDSRLPDIYEAMRKVLARLDNAEIVNELERDRAYADTYRWHEGDPEKPGLYLLWRKGRIVPMGERYKGPETLEGGGWSGDPVPTGSVYMEIPPSEV
jgi:hypothetical protein